MAVLTTVITTPGLRRTLTAQMVRALPIPPSYRWKVGGNLGDRLEGAPKAGGHEQLGIVRMAHGFRMAVDISESYERRMFYSGIYAPHLSRLVKLFLQPGDTFVDGGANIGYFSLLASRCVKREGSVHAFEPIPQTFQRLQFNIKLNNFVQVTSNCQALSEQAGELSFELPLDAASGSGLGRLATVVQMGRGPTVTCIACSLDDYAEQAHISAIKMMKLDLEGSEVTALRGMQRLLSKHRIGYVVAELNTVLLDALHIPYSGMREVFQAQGYRAYYIVPRLRGYLRLIDTALMENPDQYGDYLFVAPTMPAPPLKI